jgi:hypothetical protein
VEPQEFKAIGIACDVTKEQAVKAAFDQVVQDFGRVDVLVYVFGTPAAPLKLSQHCCGHMVGAWMDATSGEGLVGGPQRDLLRYRLPGRSLQAAHGCKCRRYLLLCPGSWPAHVGSQSTWAKAI